jgi:hypothetical protein
MSVVKKSEIAYEKYLNLIITDKTFQSFFFKRHNHKKYDDFKIMNEKEKVKFLIDFYFNVSLLLIKFSSQLEIQKVEAQAIETSNNIVEEKKDSRAFYSTTSQLDKEIMKKLGNVKNESQKETLKKKMDIYSNENDYKTKLNDIMNKYKNSQKINFSSEINTKEFRTILHTIDNIMMKTNENNESHLGDIHYLVNKFGKSEFFQVKKRKVHHLLIKEIIMDNFSEGYNCFKSYSNHLDKKSKTF